MSWLNFLRMTTKVSEIEAALIDIPLFPISGLLFPGGALSLKVFEQRYLDMAAACMRTKTPFGICLIASGKEIGTAATPHPVGTLAHIETGEMPQLGILMLKVRGGRRFRIHSTQTQPDGLLRAEVTLLDEEQGQSVPDTLQGLIPLLRKVVADIGPEKMPAPHAFDDAAWVGYRLSEIVPVQPLAKQKLLELNDPISRLEILHAYLAQRKLV